MFEVTEMEVYFTLILIAAVGILAGIILTMMVGEKRLFKKQLAKLNQLYESNVDRLKDTYLEEIRTMRWLDKMLNDGELDLTKLKNETEKRGFAMLLHQVESDVALRLETVRKIEQAIAEQQEELTRVLQYDYDEINNCRLVLEDLQKQRIEAEKYYLGAKARFDKLITHTA